MKKTLIGFMVIFLVGSAVALWRFKWEGENPQVQVVLPKKGIGLKHELAISASDFKSGLKYIRLGLKKGNTDTVLYEKHFPPGGINGFIKGGTIKETSFKVLIEPGKLNITDGNAKLTLMVKDYAWSRWWNGNRTLIEKNLIVDMKPPRVMPISTSHNIAQGGSGLVIWKVSEKCPINGVQVGENFFPGYLAENIAKSDKTNIYMTSIALDHKQSADSAVFIKAIDFGGNITKKGIRNHLRKKRFKKDTIRISDRLLNWKMPEFGNFVEVSENGQDRNLNIFLKVNQDLRKQNVKEIFSHTQSSDESIYWKGAFIRLPKSARRASFADLREYRYNRQTIDHQYHMGVDLASISHAPVPAANNGKVVFTGFIGIYGNTIIIDHGFGLFSTYSHLNDMSVEKGQMVKKEEIIGSTGTSGLVGGDHLHFAMIVHNTFVNPVEWWDGKWIKNNITEKINSARSVPASK